MEVEAREEERMEGERGGGDGGRDLNDAPGSLFKCDKISVQPSRLYD